jgi:hypothetical protein
MVCTYWKVLSEDLLYESVVLRSERGIQNFSATLERKWEEIQSQSQRNSLDLNARRHYGWFVKRLHISFPSGPWSSNPNDFAFFDKCFIPFRLCQNLDILILDSFNARPAAHVLLKEILSSGASLRHLQWDTMESLPSTSIAQNLSSIEILSLRNLYVAESGNVPLGGFTLSLPHLHTLQILNMCEIEDLSEWFATWDMPSLKRVVFDPSEGVQPSDYLPFFEKFGRQLLSVDLGWSSEPDIQTILNLCSSLQELHVNFTLLSSLEPHFTLRKLGIYLFGTAPPRESQGVEGAVENAFGVRTGALNVVRLLDLDFGSGGVDNRTGVKWTQKCIDKFIEWAKRWDELGVRFEFSSGELVLRTDMTLI